MDDRYLEEVDETMYQSNLLNTIRIPKNLHFLTERLPKPNYTPLKTKKIDKQKFLQTLGGYKDHKKGDHLLDDLVGGERHAKK
mmetsp:Transcript_11331/g.9725  ORF Transcript_11331/g.9725 Transcript_11331/m.9725 type:complete len:83 (+) Transcript_11331:266-514(+)